MGLYRFLRRARWDAERAKELQAHLDHEIDENIGRGMTPDEARRAARRKLGNATRIREDIYRMNTVSFLDTSGRDLRSSVRALRKDPTFSIIAILTLALGIGANSAIFALADAVLVRPLPFPAVGRLVVLWESRPGGTGGLVNPLDFVDWSERNRSFDVIAAMTGGGVALTGPDGRAEAVPSHAVTAGFFDVLGVQPILGRTFQGTDEGPAPDAVVLSEGLWRNRLGADPSLVGRQIRLSGRMFTVIGIVPAAFQINFPGNATPGPVGLWTLLNSPQDRSPEQRGSHYLRVLGRLKQGVTMGAAQAEMTAIAEEIARETPATNRGHGVDLAPLRAGLIGAELRLTSMLLLGVVAFVLLLCCANVANLLLARTAARARELAVRSALGAGQWRIVSLLLTESLVLATVGALLGAAVGAAIIRFAPSLMPQDLLPTAISLRFDTRVLLFCIVAAAVVAVVCGLAPAFQAMRASPVKAITFSSRTSTQRRSRFRAVIASGEVAVAILLVYGAVLLLRTLITLDSIEPGYRAGNLLTMAISPPTPGTPESMLQFYQAVEQEVRSIPGVRNAGWGSALPLDGLWYGQSFQIEGDPLRPQADRYNSGYQIVSPSYFQTLDIPMIRGRGFTNRDTAEAVQVCVVDEAFTRRYLQGREPIGLRLAVRGMGQPQAVVREIVGIVQQVKERPDEPAGQPHIYVPLAQNTWWSASLVVQRVRGRAETLTPAIRDAVARVDKERPVSRVRTLDDIKWEATARPRFRAVFAGTFSALALTLAMVGVFGVLTYSVQQRKREFGVRIALGAGVSDVLGLVLKSVTRITVAGTAAGLAAAAGLSHWIASLLFGVSPLDPWTFVAAAVILGATAAIAAAIPALRALRVNPSITLRSE